MITGRHVLESVGSWLNGDGVVFLRNRFVSVAHIEEALRRKFRIQILDDTPKSLRCKVIRYVRLLGVPWFWPHPTLSVFLVRQDDGTTLQYEFRWPEHYVGLALGTLSGVMASTADATVGSRALDAFVAFGTATLFFSMLVLLDGKYLSWRIRHILKRL